VIGHIQVHAVTAPKKVPVIDFEDRRKIFIGPLFMRLMLYIFLIRAHHYHLLKYAI
jgi:hypothetical protein